MGTKCPGTFTTVKQWLNYSATGGGSLQRRDDGVANADRGFWSIRGTLFAFVAFKIVFDPCSAADL